MKVREEINRGGFGRVELVELDDGSLAARKIFDPVVQLDSDAELLKLRKRFVREVRIQDALDSDSFVPVIDYELQGDNPWFLMPVAERNFRDEIRQLRTTGELPKGQLADILNALDELHELGYVHRDLKPENVLLLNGTWRLTDFGLVLPPTGSTTKLTSYASAWGTTSYCAPEQAIEFRNATSAVDIYAFGCILHDIYGNEPRIPYQQHTCDGPIGVIIERCTNSRPERRFRNVRALRGALLTLLATAPIVTASPSAKEWNAALKAISDWDRPKFEEFAAYIRRNEGTEDLYAVFHDLDEDQIAALRVLDEDLWKTVGLEYAAWIEHGGFDFAFCDVLVRRLEAFFADGDLELQARAAIAAAVLGRSHNRWFVMGRVLAMCGNQLSDSLAQRIQIEIRATETETDFRACADVIDREYAEFHPLIAEVLQSES